MSQVAWQALTIFALTIVTLGGYLGWKIYTYCARGREDLSSREEHIPSYLEVIDPEILDELREWDREERLRKEAEKKLREQEKALLDREIPDQKESREPSTVSFEEDAILEILPPDPLQQTLSELIENSHYQKSQQIIKGCAHFQDLVDFFQEEDSKELEELQSFFKNHMLAFFNRGQGVDLSFDQLCFSVEHSLQQPVRDIILYKLNLNNLKISRQEFYALEKAVRFKVVFSLFEREEELLDLSREEIRSLIESKKGDPEFSQWASSMAPYLIAEARKQFPEVLPLLLDKNFLLQRWPEDKSLPQ